MEKGRSVFALNFGPVHTNAFSLLSKTRRSIRVHTTVLMRFRLPTLKLSKTIELLVETGVELYVYSANTDAYDIFVHHFHFDAFSIVHTIAICMRFRFHPLSNAFVVRSMRFL